MSQYNQELSKSFWLNHAKSTILEVQVEIWKVFLYQNPSIFIILYIPCKINSCLLISECFHVTTTTTPRPKSSSALGFPSSPLALAKTNATAVPAFEQVSVPHLAVELWSSLETRKPLGDAGCSPLDWDV